MNQQEYYYICPCIAENTDDQYKSLQFLTFTQSEKRPMRKYAKCEICFENNVGTNSD